MSDIEAYRRFDSYATDCARFRDCFLFLSCLTSTSVVVIKAIASKARVHPEVDTLVYVNHFTKKEEGNPPLERVSQICESIIRCGGRSLVEFVPSHYICGKKQHVNEIYDIARLTKTRGLHKNADEVWVLDVGRLSADNNSRI
eukprot:TRINITY_DN3083_c0_g1_i1.p1 TRINITY_DN3083_c0_g1~~TRINITY_DN3083_c0_g1_i1.p1  ORF type:complete len:143 (+),score=13.86 TRINITY_DN3083_c0_g1_i1:577-1005(+)